MIRGESRKNSGITLIALVLSIIAISLIGGVLINVSIGNFKIFDFAKTSPENYKVSGAKEKLELGKATLVPNRYTLDEYIDRVAESGTIDKEKVVDIDDNNVYVIVDGYVFRVTEDDDNNGEKDGKIKYYYISTLKDIQPQVVIKNITTTTGSVTVEVKSNFANNEKYEYYIKDAEDENANYVKDGDLTTEKTHTFTNLTQNKIYSIKAVLKMSGKNDAEAEQNARTIEMKNLQQAEIVFTQDKYGWTNTDVEVTVTITNEEVQEQITKGAYKIQTMLNDASFENTDKQTATAQNDIIKATVTDGYGNYTIAATHKVETIDKEKPNTTAPTLIGKTTSTINVQYEQQDVVTKVKEDDVASGIQTRKYRLTNEEGTTGTWQTTGTFEGLTHGQTYYVQTYAQDEAENEQLSNVLTVTLETVSLASGASYTPTALTSGDVTVTLPTVQGYTTRYTTNGNSPTKDSTQYTGPFTVPSNCTVKYVYTDGTNIGGAGTATIQNIDKTNYAITYNMNGVTGVTHSNPKTTYKVDDNNFTLVNPSKSGYTFIGWTGGNFLGLDQYTTSNPYVCTRRDHVIGNEFNGSAGTTYRVYVTAKRTRGSVDLRGGIWYTEQSTGAGYDGYSVVFPVYKTLSDGWAIYYRDVTVPTGKTKGKFYIQLEQSESAGWSTDWSIANMEITMTTITVPKGTQGNKTYTAHWSYDTEIWGSGLNQTTRTNRVYIGGTQANTSAGRGLTIVKFNKFTGAVTHTASYDTYGDNNARTNLANIINGATNDELIGIFSQDATAFNDTLKNALINAGIPSGRIWYAPNNTSANSGSRIPTAIFLAKGYTSQSGMVEAFTEAHAPTAYIKINVRDGIPTRQSYSINYNLNGGELPSGYKSWYLPTDNNFNLTNPTKSGYGFSGWTGSNGSSAQTTVTIAKGSTGDKTYTANWSTNNYTVTYEDWFVDGSNNRKTMIGSTTKSKAYGSTVNGNELGTDTTLSKYYSYYQYKSSTSATVTTSGATVYRYFWAWNDINVMNPENVQKGDGSVATFSVSYNGGSWVTGQSNETQASIILPWGATISIKDITMKQTYYSLNNVTWNGSQAISASNGTYTATVKEAGKVISINMKYNSYTVDVNPKIKGTKYNSGQDGYTFNVDIDGTRNATGVKDWCQSVKYGSKVKVTPVGKTGYNNSAASEQTVGTSGLEFIPEWSLINYSISYTLNGGSVSNQPTSYNIESNNFTLPIAYKAMYRFSGWTGSNVSTANRSVTISKGSTGNKSYTANFATNNTYYKNTKDLLLFTHTGSNNSKRYYYKTNATGAICAVAYIKSADGRTMDSTSTSKY